MVVAHDLRQDGRGRRAFKGRALGRGLRVGRRRERRQRRPRQDARPLRHELAEIQPGAASEDIERLPKAHLVVLGHEADDVAGRPTPEAVEEALGGRDGEGSRLLLVEGAAGHHHPALPLDLDAALRNDRGQVVRRLDGFDPLFGDLHLSSPPFGVPRKPGSSGERPRT